MQPRSNSHLCYRADQPEGPMQPSLLVIEAIRNFIPQADPSKLSLNAGTHSTIVREKTIVMYSIVTFRIYPSQPK